MEKNDKLRSLEIYAENMLFASRWVLIPIFYLFPIALLVLVGEFVKSLFNIVVEFFKSSNLDGVVIGSLELVDISLVCGLILIAMFAGYENFVSKLDIDNHPDYPHWMRNITFSKLKILVLATAVPMSIIHLLAESYMIDQTSNRELIVSVVFVFVFVFAAIGMAYMDYLLSLSAKNKVVTKIKVKDEGE